MLSCHYLKKKANSQMIENSLKQRHLFSKLMSGQVRVNNIKNCQCLMKISWKTAAFPYLSYKWRSYLSSQKKVCKGVTINMEVENNIPKGWMETTLEKFSQNY